ncbi:MAG: DNA-protecting protein DprA [Campylobacterales bacterium]|nr:DNA-protecting protein DprA [Campylobacterales bacterium]
MSEFLLEKVPALEAMRKYPDELYYSGNTALLSRVKLSIVGSRRADGYSRFMTSELSAKLSRAGVCIVSGGAMGIDATAHAAAGASNTIAVLGSGIDIRYPATNRALLDAIGHDGLLLSPFADGFKATPWSFVVRNEIVAALGDALIVTQADENSGSMRSVEHALRMGKKIYVLPHRIGESEGTNWLLKEGKAEAIYDIDAFVSGYGEAARCVGDAFLDYCRTAPSYEDAVRDYPQEVFRYELEGKIAVVAGKISVLV